MPANVQTMAYYGDVPWHNLETPVPQGVAPDSTRISVMPGNIIRSILNPLQISPRRSSRATMNADFYYVFAFYQRSSFANSAGASPQPNAII